METEKKNKLTLAIIQVMKAVRGMEKNSDVGKGQSAYKGTRDMDVKEVFNKEMADAGLVILPIDIEESTDITKWTEKTQWGDKQKQSVFTKVKVKYLLMHESGESMELAGAGHGVDPQDKGIGKALTYSLKNTLLYTFLTPVGKIDDTDNTHSDDIATALPMIDAALFDTATKAIASTPTPEFKAQYKAWAESFGENTYKTQILELCK